MKQEKYHIKTAVGLEQLPQAAEIRQEVFVEEQGFHNEFDEIDPIAVHLLVLEGEAPVAAGRTYPDETGKVWHLGRICVRKPWRGRQLGRMVMEGLENAAKERGAEKFMLSAQVQAKRFYEKLGYHPYGQEYLDEFCPHIAMEKTIL